MNRTIGLHLQFHTSILVTAVARKALQLQLLSFILFCPRKKTRPLKLTKEDKKEFLSLLRSFKAIYMRYAPQLILVLKTVIIPYF